MNSYPRLRDERGMSLVEVLLGVMLLSVVLLGLAGAGAYAARMSYRGRLDMRLGAAEQWAADSLRSAGWSKVQTGSGTVQGYPITWTVSGTNPKTVKLVAQWVSATRKTVKDTVVLFVANPTP
jgi:Tfp pilus assembly protein PilV